MRKILFPLLVAAATLLTGCYGTNVVINPAEVGRELNPSGLSETILQPSSFNLDWCMYTCPKLVRLEVAKATREITIERVFLPKSNVDLSDVEIAMQFRVRQDQDSINTVFSEVTPQPAGVEDTMLISNEMIYATYLERIGPEAVIEALREYTVEDVLSNVGEIGAHSRDMVNQRLGDSPVEVTELSFPNGIGDPPEEVLVAKRLLYAVDEEKAREVKALEAELAVEEQRQAVQMARAKNDLAVAKVVGVRYDVYTELKIMERFAEEEVPLGYIPGASGR